MKIIIKFPGLGIFLWLLSNSLFADSGLISVEDLASIMKDRNTIIAFCGTSTEYRKARIPGAVNISLIELYCKPASNGYIKSPHELAGYFGSKGISETKRIVLYDEGSGKYSGRVYWILKYLGAKDVKILDGQMKAWRAGRKPVARAPVSVKATTFTPSVNKALLATTSRVKAAPGVIVDVRSPEEFMGTDKSELRKGHIPGAVNLEFKKVMDGKTAKIKSCNELKRIFFEKGIIPDKEIILYCRTSVRAGIVFFTLTDILGYKNVKVYDKAFFGWQADAANKVVR